MKVPGKFRVWITCVDTAILASEAFLASLVFNNLFVVHTPV